MFKVWHKFRGAAEVTLRCPFDTFLHSFPMHRNHLKLFLKGPSQQHLCFLFIYKSLAIIFYLEIVKAKEITV